MSGLSKKRDGSNARAIYLSIIGGELKQKVTAEATGAVKRTYDLKDDKGVKTGEGHKWEIQHQDIFGVITDVIFKDGDFGEQLVIKIYNEEDDMTAVISTQSSGRYGTDFMKKFRNIDLTKPIVFNSYDFEDDKGKERKGVSIIQDVVKITSFYYDFKAKKSINGLPPVDKKMFESLGKDYWKIFFITEKGFLKGEVEEASKLIPKVEKVEKQTEKVADEVPGEQDGLPF